MGWARIDDTFHDHPKVDDISLAAVGAWILCLTWAHRHRRTAKVPGHIPEARVRKVAGSRARQIAQELVDAGLWENANGLGGYLIHDFREYLPKERDPEERAAAGAKGGRRRWQNRNGQTQLPDGDDERETP